MGCILTLVVGDGSKTLTIETNLLLGDLSYLAIAEILLKNPELKQLLLGYLEDELKVRRVSFEEFEKNGLLHNSTARSIANRYSYMDWDNTDLSTKILLSESTDYMGLTIRRSIVRTNGQKIIVVNPNSYDEVRLLNKYLRIEYKLKNPDTETEEIVNNAKIAFDSIKDIKDYLKLLKVKFEEIKKKNGGKLTDASKKLLGKIELFEAFEKYTPSTIYELILDYIESEGKYAGLTYKAVVVDGDKVSTEYKSVDLLLKNIVKLLLGKDVTVKDYKDIFANTIYDSVDWTREGLPYITLDGLKLALELKIKLIQEQKDKTETEKNFISKAKKLINKTKVEEKEIKEVYNLGLQLTDSEFSYLIDYFQLEDKRIYLKNVPNILENRDEIFRNYNSLELFSFVESYNGYNIYKFSLRNGDSIKTSYYYDRHLITTKSYSSKFYTIDDVRKAIDKRVKNDSIGLLTLIEIKSRREGDEYIFTPNKYIPGQIIKSKKIKLDFRIDLNASELKLLYNIEKGNTLSEFFNYIKDFVSEGTFKKILNIIKTSEDVACFIYLINQKDNFGTVRTKMTKVLDLKKLDNILNQIKDAEIEYFMVGNVGDATYPGKGFKKYYSYNEQSKEYSPKYVYKTTLIPISKDNITKLQVIEIDKAYLAPIPMVEVLRNLSKKINDRLGVLVEIMTNSTLKDFEKRNNIKLPSGVRGFVYGGKIYINASNCTANDLFHEFTHIVLGVLRGVNSDNYYKLVETVANKAKSVKRKLKKYYPDLADMDLNEEVFAYILSNSLSGKDTSFLFDDNDDSIMKLVKKDAKKLLTNIFSKEEIDDEFFVGKALEIVNLFSYDLAEKLREPNGLEININLILGYHAANRWISEQIRAYKDSKDSDNKIGILEDCY